MENLFEKKTHFVISLKVFILLKLLRPIKRNNVNNFVLYFILIYICVAVFFTSSCQFEMLRTYFSSIFFCKRQIEEMNCICKENESFYQIFSNDLFFWSLRPFQSVQIGRASCRERVLQVV